MTSREIPYTKLVQKQKNKSEIYSALYNLNFFNGKKEATVKEIRTFLLRKTKYENDRMCKEVSARYNLTSKQKRDLVKKNTKIVISERTIQRHLKEDKRIVKNGRFYSIHERDRFELRHIHPVSFGIDIYRKLVHEFEVNSTKEGFENNIKQYITTFGSLVFFIFIEAVRQFPDPSLSTSERDELVFYWARNAIPLDAMFRLFHALFNVEDLYNEKDSVLELSDKRIDLLLETLQKVYPDIHESLSQARNLSSWYPGSEDLPEFHIHGKALEKLYTEDTKHVINPKHKIDPDNV